MKKLGRDIIDSANDAFMSPERIEAERAWLDIAHYCCPSQEPLFTNKDHTRGVSAPVSQLYTNEAILAGQTLTSTMQSTLLNESTYWIKPTFTDATLMDDEESARWIDFVGKRILTEFSTSNFYTEAAKVFKALVYFATGAMVIDENNPTGAFKGIKCKGLHITQCAWFEGDDGVVNRVYIQESLSVENVLSRYSKLPKALYKKLKNNPTERVNIISAHLPNLDGTFKMVAVDVETATVLFNEKVHEQAIMVPRWSTMSGEAIGWGCGHAAVPDARVLSIMRFENLQGRALNNRPPVVVEQDNIIGTLKIKSGSIINVSSLDGIRAMDLRVDTASMRMDEKDLRLSIQQAFLLDKIALPPRTSIGEMSAYEVSRRVSEMTGVISGTISRIYSEFLVPAATRTLGILYRKAQLGKIPDEVKRRGEISLVMKFDNPLARSKEFEGVQALQSSMQVLAPMAQVNPEVMAVYDTQRLPLQVCRDLGVPEGYLSSSDDINQKVRQHREQEAAKIQAQQAATLERIET